MCRRRGKKNLCGTVFAIAVSEKMKMVSNDAEFTYIPYRRDGLFGPGICLTQMGSGPEIACSLLYFGNQYLTLETVSFMWHTSCCFLVIHVDQVMVTWVCLFESSGRIESIMQKESLAKSWNISSMYKVCLYWNANCLGVVMGCAPCAVFVGLIDYPPWIAI